MNILSVGAIKTLLASDGIKPKKFLGQNFLVDKTAIDKIIAAANMGESDTVVEIGPGVGTLTQALVKKAKKVITIEKDGAMVEILKETLRDYKHVEVIQGDILKLSMANFQLSSYKVVANIPYYITSPIIRMFLEAKHPPTEIILLVQKEVAQRICAKPPNMSILAVSVQFYATPKIISYVSKNCFWPAPKVDSAIIKITSFKETLLVNSDDFFKVVKAGFVQPRKQLVGNLSKMLKKDKKVIGLWLLRNNIQPTQRAETLSVENWVRLTKSKPF